MTCVWPQLAQSGTESIAPSCGAGTNFSQKQPARSHTPRAVHSPQMMRRCASHGRIESAAYCERAARARRGGAVGSVRAVVAAVVAV